MEVRRPQATNTVCLPFTSFGTTPPFSRLNLVFNTTVLNVFVYFQRVSTWRPSAPPLPAARVSPPLPTRAAAAVAALPCILKDRQILSRVCNAGRFKHDNECSCWCDGVDKGHNTKTSCLRCYSALNEANQGPREAELLGIDRKRRTT